MSEKLHHNQESHEHEKKHELEKKDLPNIERLNQEALEKAAEQPKVEHLKDTVEKHAKSAHEVKAKAPDNSGEKREFSAYTALKGETYSRTLNRIQQKLSRPERTMSKIMHNKAVEKVSDGMAKTAARPSGILGGGIFSLIGSVILLYMTKKYGFEYNFFMFFVFLGVGFMLGVVVELVIFSIKKVRR